MKLACVRCKHKKIKCDKGEPTCHQCNTAKTDCRYVERRKRPRLVPDKAAAQHLSQRLESLEKQLVAEQNGFLLSPSQTSVRESLINTAPLGGSPNNALVQENGRESWIYRMATDARRGFLKANPASPAHTDKAMSALDEALDDLGKFKVQVVEGNPSTTSLKISSAESRECIDAFLSLFRAMFMVEIFGKNGFPEVDILYTFPDLVSSPFVTFEPGIHVLYYNAVFYGLHQLRGTNDVRTQAAYRKVLDSVPAWLASPSEQDLDGWTAALTAWTAIVHFDYQLSWRFHCKSCHFIKKRGLDVLDAVPAATREEEMQRNELRPLYWHALWCDMFFRLFYGKPRVMDYWPDKVKPLDIFATGNVRPKASQVMLVAVFMQSTVMTAEIMQLIDTASSEASEGVLAHKVEQFCCATEELVEDWNLEVQLHCEATPTSTRHVMADYLMSLFSVIVGVKRLTRRPNQEHPVDQTTLRAARKVVSVVLEHAAPFLTDQTHRFVSIQFISFYPFCAVFSLYEYILVCTDPEDCEGDLRALETLGSVMTQASSLRTDFASMAKTINALNKVSRTFQDDRLKNTPTTARLLSNPDQQSNGFNPPASTLSEFQPPLSDTSQHAAAEISTFPEFTGDGYLEALDFVRSLETDLLEGNWHEELWNIDSGTNST